MRIQTHLAKLTLVFASIFLPCALMAQTITTEAESMTKSNYITEANSVGSGGNIIKLSGYGVTGNATFNFSGASGTYSIKVYYFDENDGASPFKLYVNGVVVDQWTANLNLGSSLADANTYTSRTKTGVSISNGQQIKIEATQNAEEWGRVDKIEIIGSLPPGVSMEAESAAKVNYIVEANSSASGGNLVKLSAAGVTGNASYSFSGTTGTYDIKVYYYDENDGASPFKLYVNGVVVDQWTANQDLGSTLAVAQTRTSRTKSGVSISNGAIVKVEATQNGDEWGRIDRIEITAPSTWILTWSDEFTGTGSPDSTKWNVQNFLRRPNSTGPDGYWDPADAYLDGSGNLAIRVRRVANRNGDGDAHDYNSGAVSTDGVGSVSANAKFKQTYGKFEIRAQMPQMQGWWVSFWMMQGNEGGIGNGGVDGSEVDIFEGWGWTDKINHAIHWDGYGASHQSVSKSEVISGIRTGWHTFTLIWDPDVYIVYVDGVEQWRTTGGGICNQPGYILLTGEVSTESWATANTWAKTPEGVAYPDYFLIDYVRAYRRGP